MRAIFNIQFFNVKKNDDFIIIIFLKTELSKIKYS